MFKYSIALFISLFAGIESSALHLAAMGIRFNPPPPATSPPVTVSAIRDNTSLLVSAEKSIDYPNTPFRHRQP